MDGLREYVLSAMAAALLCALVQRFLEGKGSAAAVGKSICGIYMAFTLISPLTDFDMFRLSEFTGSIQNEALLAADSGIISANNALEQRIKDQTEAYILDKAAQFDADLTVEIMLSDGDIPVPVGVKICGKISPYAKNRLQEILKDELGIAKEDQQWI